MIEAGSRNPLIAQGYANVQRVLLLVGVPSVSQVNGVCGRFL